MWPTNNSSTSIWVFKERFEIVKPDGNENIFTGWYLKYFIPIIKSVSLPPTDLGTLGSFFSILSSCKTFIQVVFNCAL